AITNKMKQAFYQLSVDKKAKVLCNLYVSNRLKCFELARFSMFHSKTTLVNQMAKMLQRMCTTRDLLNSVTVAQEFVANMTDQTLLVQVLSQCEPKVFNLLIKDISDQQLAAILGKMKTFSKQYQALYQGLPEGRK